MTPSAPSTAARVRRRTPSPFRAPSRRGSIRAAVSSLTRISPASAAASMATVVEADGPAISSSRWESPTRKSRNAAEWTPTDIRSWTVPAELDTRPISRRRARIRSAARQALLAWSGPLKNSRSASPPNFSRLPPASYADPSRSSKSPPMMSATSSAPIGPRRASRSESLVNPDTST
jgi:hypothetical protein